MKTWIANLLWDALWIFLRRVHDWAFEPERHARIRMTHRERWWAAHCRAQETDSKRDDARARAWAIQFEFKTPPAVAKVRGDLDPLGRQAAADAMDRSRAARRGDGPAADRAKP